MSTEEELEEEAALSLCSLAHGQAARRPSNVNAEVETPSALNAEAVAVQVLAEAVAAAAAASSSVNIQNPAQQLAGHRLMHQLKANNHDIYARPTSRALALERFRAKRSGANGGRTSMAAGAKRLRGSSPGSAGLYEDNSIRKRGPTPGPRLCAHIGCREQAQLSTTRMRRYCDGHMAIYGLLPDEGISPSSGNYVSAALTASAAPTGTTMALRRPRNRDGAHSGGGGGGSPGQHQSGPRRLSADGRSSQSSMRGAGDSVVTAARDASIQQQVALSQQQLLQLQLQQNQHMDPDTIQLLWHLHQQQILQQQQQQQGVLTLMPDGTLAMVQNPDAGTQAAAPAPPHIQGQNQQFLAMTADGKLVLIQQDQMYAMQQMQQQQQQQQQLQQQQQGLVPVQNGQQQGMPVKQDPCVAQASCDAPCVQSSRASSSGTGLQHGSETAPASAMAPESARGTSVEAAPSPVGPCAIVTAVALPSAATGMAPGEGPQLGTQAAAAYAAKQQLQLLLAAVAERSSLPRGDQQGHGAGGRELLGAQQWLQEQQPMSQQEEEERLLQQRQEAIVRELILHQEAVHRQQLAQRQKLQQLSGSGVAALDVMRLQHQQHQRQQEELRVQLLQHVQQLQLREAVRLQQQRRLEEQQQAYRRQVVVRELLWHHEQLLQGQLQQQVGVGGPAQEQLVQRQQLLAIEQLLQAEGVPHRRLSGGQQGGTTSALEQQQQQQQQSSIDARELLIQAAIAQHKMAGTASDQGTAGSLAPPLQPALDRVEAQEEASPHVAVASSSLELNDPAVEALLRGGASGAGDKSKAGGSSAAAVAVGGELSGSVAKDSVAVGVDVSSPKSGDEQEPCGMAGLRELLIHAAIAQQQQQQQELLVRQLVEHAKEIPGSGACSTRSALREEADAETMLLLQQLQGRVGNLGGGGGGDIQEQLLLLQVAVGQQQKQQQQWQQQQQQHWREQQQHALGQAVLAQLEQQWREQQMGMGSGDAAKDAASVLATQLQQQPGQATDLQMLQLALVRQQQEPQHIDQPREIDMHVLQLAMAMRQQEQQQLQQQQQGVHTVGMQTQITEQCPVGGVELAEALRQRMEQGQRAELEQRLVMQVLLMQQQQQGSRQLSVQGVHPPQGGGGMMQLDAATVQQLGLSTGAKGGQPGGAEVTI